MEQPKWDVLESAYLGIFSFSQFVMWNDLHNRTEDLMNSKLVKSLVDGKISWEAKSFDSDSTVDEVRQLLGVSKSYAYKVIRKMNSELRQQGYHTIAGRVSKTYFLEKVKYQKLERSK